MPVRVVRLDERARVDEFSITPGAEREGVLHLHVEMVRVAIGLARVAVTDELLALLAIKILRIVPEPDAERPRAAVAVVDVGELQCILLLAGAASRRIGSSC